MDSFERNKIAGAILFTLLVMMTLGIVSDLIYKPAVPEKPGFVIEVAEAPAEGAAGAAAAAEPPIANLLQAANVEAGAAVAKKCVACHSFGKGEPAKAGPNLYNVVTGPIGHMDGFKYSAAIQEHHGKGDTWTYDNLNHFLKKPSAFMPGTAMGFAGLPKPEDRANVIAYLHSLSDSPATLPAPEAAPAAGEAAPAAEKPAEAAPAAPAEAAPAEAAPAPAAPAASEPAPAAPAPAASEPAPAPETPAAAPAEPAPAEAPKP